MLNLRKYILLVFLLNVAAASFAQNTGINTKNPTSNSVVNGSFAADYKIVTATNTVLGITDYYTAYNGSSAGNITLPVAISGTGGFKGRIYCIKNTSSSSLTVAASGAEQIDGATNLSSIIVPPGYYIKLVSKGTTTGSTWELLLLLSGKTDEIIQLTGTSYAATQGTAPTVRFDVTNSAYTIVTNSSNTFTLPVAKPIFLSFALGVDDFTADNSATPYFRCELYIDGVASGLFQIVQEYNVGYQMQFNISGVRSLSAGTHTIDARVTRWYNSGYSSTQNFGTLSVFFNAVYLN